jgi:hypothetical protein
MSKERYIIQMVGGLEPVVHGPYKNEGSRTRAVRKLHREMDYEDNVFALDMFPVEAWAWSAGFFEDSDLRGPLGNPGRGPGGVVKDGTKKDIASAIMGKLGY